ERALSLLVNLARLYELREDDRLISQTPTRKMAGPRSDEAARATLTDLPTPAGEPREVAGLLRSKHNLALQPTSFVGRERELADAAERLCDGRLLTLTGAGGCCKTCLALEVVRAVVDAYPDCAWLVDPAPQIDPDLVPWAIGAALGLREKPGRRIVEA